MLDMRWIRENRKDLEQMLQARNNAFSVGELYDLDEKRREILTSMEEKKARRNEGSKKVGLLKKQGENAEPLMEEMRFLGDEIKGMEEELSRIDAGLEEIVLQIPNLPHETVPLGMDETNNPVIHHWGEPRKFDFEPQPHWDLGESLGILDFERGVKLAESRFTVIRGKGALLMRGLTQFMLDLHTREHGFEEIMPPLLVNSATMQGTGQLPKLRMISTVAPRTISGSFLLQRFLLPIFMLEKFWRKSSFPSISPLTLPASAANREPMEGTCGEFCGSTSSTKWSW